MEDLKHEIKDTKGCGKRCHASRLASKTPRSSGLTSHAQWPKVKLGEIGRVAMCKRVLNRETADTGEIPFFKIGTFGKKANAFITRDKFEYYRTHYSYPQKGNVLISAAGTIGRLVVFNGEPAYFQDSNIVWLEHDGQRLCDKYLYYFLLGHEWQFTQGATIQRLYNDDIRSTEIPLPPLPVQRRIADVLSAYDGLIENNRRRIAILEGTARLAYRKWFGGANTARTATLGEICQAFGGGTPKTTSPEFWDGDIPWVVPTDITRNTCLALLDTERKITALGLQKSSAKMLPANAILMTSRASVGYFGMADFPVCTNQGFISIVPNNDSWRWYLLFNLMSRVEEIRSNAKGSTFPEISRARFRSMDVAIPEDNALIEFNNVVEPLMQQVRILAKQNAFLATARDMLLPRLMKGDLV